MRKTIAAMMVLCLALLGACGGDDEEAREGALVEGPDKPSEPPAGAKIPSVTEHQNRANTDCRATFNAAWAESPKSFAEGVRMAKNVVEAEVAEVKAAEDLVVQASEEPGGEYRIPTQQVVVKVIKKHKGALSEGQNTMLFQTGNACQFLDGDPPYKVGEKHLLLLTDGPKGLQRTISPEGRFKELADGTLEAASHNAELVKDVAGKKLADLGIDKLVGGVGASLPSVPPLN